MSKDYGGPAFPAPGGNFSGMTLRDYLAAKAMAALVAAFPAGATIDMDLIARNAYLQADAMLKARIE
jgi:hypothetical protein